MMQYPYTADGEAYSEWSFVEQYGGTAEWQAAAPGGRGRWGRSHAPLHKLFHFATIRYVRVYQLVKPVLEILLYSLCDAVCVVQPIHYRRY